MESELDIDAFLEKSSELSPKSKLASQQHSPIAASKAPTPWKAGHVAQRSFVVRAVQRVSVAEENKPLDFDTIAALGQETSGLTKSSSTKSLKAMFSTFHKKPTPVSTPTHASFMTDTEVVKFPILDIEALMDIGNSIENVKLVSFGKKDASGIIISDVDHVLSLAEPVLQNTPVDLGHLK